MTSRRSGSDRLALFRAVGCTLLVLLAPRAAQACAVCVSSRDDGTQLGFLIGTLIMLPLPFVVVGGLLFYLWRRSRAAASEVIRPASSPS